MELSPNQCYGPCTVGNVAYNVTTKKRGKGFPATIMKKLISNLNLTMSQLKLIILESQFNHLIQDN